MGADGHVAVCSITEEGLRSISWGLIGPTAEGKFLVEGTWPGGEHAFFLRVPVDVVTPARPTAIFLEFPALYVEPTAPAASRPEAGS